MADEARIEPTASGPAAAGAGPPQRRPGGARMRALGVAALAAVLVASGFGLRGETASGRPARSSAHAARSGAWFCPHGGGDGWTAWIALTNPGPDPVRVRLTSLGERGSVDQATITVPGDRQVMREVPATKAASSTFVEFFGGWVAAGSLVRTASVPSWTAAARCASGPHRSWFVPDASTARDTTSYLIVMNPFSQDAAVDVTIRTDKRGAVRPGALTPYVVRAGTSVALGLNGYVLQAPDEQIVSGEIEVHLGRVVAGGLTVSDAGLRSDVGTAGVQTRWVLPAARYRTPSTIALLNPGDERADVEVVAQGQSYQKLVTGLDTISLGPGESKAYGLGSLLDAGVVVQSRNGVPFVAVRRLDGEAGDTATLGGEADGARAWVVSPAVDSDDASEILLLENPDREAATVSLRYLDASGQAKEPATVTVQPGRTITVDLSGAGHASVIVVAESGTIVAASASLSDGEAYSASLGVPVPAGVLRVK